MKKEITEHLQRVIYDKLNKNLNLSDMIDLSISKFLESGLLDKLFNKVLVFQLGIEEDAWNKFKIIDRSKFDKIFGQKLDLLISTLVEPKLEKFIKSKEFIKYIDNKVSTVLSITDKGYLYSYDYDIKRKITNNISEKINEAIAEAIENSIQKLNINEIIKKDIESKL
jgi:hypothetical protein